MRRYQSNNPDAMARKQAAFPLSRENFRFTEFEIFDRCGVQTRQLLNRIGLLSVVQTLYEDLTRCGHLIWNDVRHVDPVTLDWLAAEAQERQVRRDTFEQHNSRV
jgi:hypothetical protein